MNIHYEILPSFPPSWAKEAGEDQYGIWAEFEIEGIVQCMRWIPPGTFIMGSPESEEGRFDIEKQHEVTLTKGYWLADTPCTQELWEKVMKENPTDFKSPQNPVETVNWDDCNNFLTRINQMHPGLDLVLPTEAQWEYGCRAGTETATYAGDLTGDDKKNKQLLDPIAWYYENNENKTHPVKKKLPNSWGLYDMHGNVWEWCVDMFADYPEQAVKDPLHKKGGSPVLRGGCWFSDARNVRSAYRFDLSRDLRYYYFGFRFSRG